MQIKVDTKEKLNVLYLPNSVFSANMADELAAIVAKILQQPVKNIVINFAEISEAEKSALPILAGLYEKTLENNASFLLCKINVSIKKLLEELDLADVLNIVPTESEAFDLTYMEEMEREMFDEK